MAVLVRVLMRMSGVMIVMRMWVIMPVLRVMGMGMGMGVRVGMA
jgi:hypothetical protein